MTTTGATCPLCGSRVEIQDRLMPRLPLPRPLTPMEWIVAAELSADATYGEIATRRRLSWRAVRAHVERAAAKIPGTLRPRERLVAWYRGAGRDVLAGGRVTLS